MKETFYDKTTYVLLTFMMGWMKYEKIIFGWTSPLNQLFATVNAELKKLSEWFNANNLSLNIDKTKYALFHPTHKKAYIPAILPALSISGVIIKRSSVNKFLGILIDENLSWNSHINYINNKISKNLGTVFPLNSAPGAYLKTDSKGAALIRGRR